MSVYIRRFGFDPGNEVLLEIESVNILDLDPPADIQGVGTGTVCIVGEFEDGPFAAQAGTMAQGAYEVSGGTDFVQQAGSLGYAYAGVSSNNPCARKRSADGAATPENWNGNGFIQLSGKKFSRLLIARADTSVGSVQFQRQAAVQSASPQSFYDLEPAQVLALIAEGTTLTATFNAAAASLVSGVGTYPNGFVGGETLVMGYDAQPNFTVTFLAGDTTRANVITRINQYAGITFATADGVATKIDFAGVKRGTAGEIRVVSGSTGVLTALGLTAATTAGTGNVSNIDSVSFQEVKSVVEAAMSASFIKVSQAADGSIVAYQQYQSANDWLQVAATTTATALGFVIGQQGANTGRAYVRTTGGTYATTFAGGETLTLGDSDSANTTIVFTSADQAITDVIARINGIMGFTMARQIDSTHFELNSSKNGGEVRVVGASSGVLAKLGLSVTTADGVAVAAGSIPAGTVVQNAAGTQKFVTMQAVSVSVDPVVGMTASGAGPYPVKVRHATDDGTGTSATASTIVAFERPVDLASFQVTNPANIATALTEAAIDAAYVDALNATKDTNGVTREINLIFSARQSNAVRKALKSNVIDASSSGCFGRIAMVRPPLNTSRATALSGSAQPGVGAYRDQRVVYCYPAANTFIPLVAKRGLAGGTGFTADGNVDVGFDGFVASICSQLPPEENPGQATDFASAINGVETGANAQGFQMGDYKQFRAKGIAALRMDNGDAIIQSGVTSVDPQVNPELRNIARRRMADFIQDSIALRGKGYGKKLSTQQRRIALANEIRSFLGQLLSVLNPSSQRIAGWSVNTKSGNTPETLEQGLYRIIINVRTLASLDSIVLQTTIGEQVEVTEQLPQAA